MYRIFLIAILTAFLIGCQGDRDMQQTAQDQSIEQDPFQQQQPMAETDVSDDELEKFVEVNVEFRDVQMEAQQEMMTVLEDEDLSAEAYNQIAQGRQMGQADEDLNVSAEDLEKFESASETIAGMEEELDAEFEDAIADAGMTMERFQEINMAIQQNPELMQRAQQMIQESSGMQQQPTPTPPAEY